MNGKRRHRLRTVRRGGVGNHRPRHLWRGLRRFSRARTVGGMTPFAQKGCVRVDVEKGGVRVRREDRVDGVPASVQVDTCPTRYA
jgi:hypothetical protein